MASSTSPSTTAGRSSVPLVIGGLLAAIVASSVVNAIIAVIAHAAGASDDFRPLKTPSYVSFTLLGVLIGALGWSIVRKMSADPDALLRKLVPIVVVLSFIPDLAMPVSDYQPHADSTGVAALIIMHITTAAIAVFAYRKVLPVSTTD
ncbi:DUF6069 family protein [Streptomyces sp. NBC_00457]|uniref:DUF6069 family protein n=1 Tax=Streptomyces sp. NBC_00457 TaxID=2975748 RepID=UPI002E24E970